jgi:excisionase family DNA binding protein
MDTRYISLHALAARLGLPQRFLREQARRGVIPHLCVGGRMRFEEGAVCEALRRQAARPSKADAGPEVERGK